MHGWWVVCARGGRAAVAPGTAHGEASYLQLWVRVPLVARRRSRRLRAAAAAAAGGDGMVDEGEDDDDDEDEDGDGDATEGAEGDDRGDADGDAPWEVCGTSTHAQKRDG